MNKFLHQARIIGIATLVSGSEAIGAVGEFISPPFRSLALNYREMDLEYRVEEIQACTECTLPDHEREFPHVLTDYNHTWLREHMCDTHRKMVTKVKHHLHNKRLHNER